MTETGNSQAAKYPPSVVAIGGAILGYLVLNQFESIKGNPERISKVEQKIEAIEIKIPALENIPLEIQLLGSRFEALEKSNNLLSETLKVSTSSRYTSEDANHDRELNKRELMDIRDDFTREINNIRQEFDKLNTELSRRADYMDGDDKRHFALEMRVKGLEGK